MTRAPGILILNFVPKIHAKIPQTTIQSSKHQLGSEVNTSQDKPYSAYARASIPANPSAYPPPVAFFLPITPKLGMLFPGAAILSLTFVR
jgi:hypothetical protein